MSCKYCGRIHPVGTECQQKPARLKEKTEAAAVRNTHRWQRTRERVKERDLYVCRACLEEGTITRQLLEAHHITPIHEDPDRANDDDNVITLCTAHHKLADAGKIDRTWLYHLAGADPTLPPRG